MKSRIKEQGNVLHIVIIVVLVVVVLGALGFIFWQNFVNNSGTNTQGSNSQAMDSTDNDGIKSSQLPIDYRTSGDTTGIVVKATADVDNLTNAPEGFKQYLATIVGKQTSGCTGTSSAVIDQVDEKFAIGDFSSGCSGAYTLWGSLDGAAWTQLQAIHQGGFDCVYVDDYNLPASFTNSQCRDDDGSLRKV